MGTAVAELNTAIEEKYEDLRRHARHKLQNMADADDVTHEVIAKALDYVKRNPDFRSDNWSHWLWRILNNSLIDRYRLYGRRENITYSLDEPISSIYSTSDVMVAVVYAESATEGGTGDQDKIGTDLGFMTDYAADLDRKMEAKKLYSGLNMLNHNQRMIVTRCDIDGEAPSKLGPRLWPDKDRVAAGECCRAVLHRGRATLGKVMRGEPVQIRRNTDNSRLSEAIL